MDDVVVGVFALFVAVFFTTVFLIISYGAGLYCGVVRMEYKRYMTVTALPLLVVATALWFVGVTSAWMLASGAASFAFSFVGYVTGLNTEES